MFGYLTRMVQNILIKLENITPKRFAEILSAKGRNGSEFSITVDDETYSLNSFSLNYNVEKEYIPQWGYSEDHYIDKNLPAGQITLSPESGVFSIDIAPPDPNSQDGWIFFRNMITIQAVNNFYNPRLGIGTKVPMKTLHVKGEIRIDATTSNTASAGAATLPASPEKFLIVDVHGTNYKIPLYRV